MANLAILEGTENETTEMLDRLFNCNDELGVALVGPEVWQRIKANVCNVALKAIAEYRIKGGHVVTQQILDFVQSNVNANPVLQALGPNVCEVCEVCGPELLGWSLSSAAKSLVKGVKKVAGGVMNRINPLNYAKKIAETGFNTLNFAKDSVINMAVSAYEVPIDVVTSWGEFLSQPSWKKFKDAVASPYGFYAKNWTNLQDYMDAEAPGLTDIAYAVTPVTLIGDAINAERRPAVTPVQSLMASAAYAGKAAAIASKNRAAWEFCEPIRQNLIKDGFSQDIADAVYDAAEYAHLNNIEPNEKLKEEYPNATTPEEQQALRDAAIQSVEDGATLAAVLKLVDLVGLDSLRGKRFIFSNDDIKSLIAYFIAEEDEQIRQAEVNEKAGKVLLYGGIVAGAYFLLTRKK